MCERERLATETEPLTCPFLLSLFNHTHKHYSSEYQTLLTAPLEHRDYQIKAHLLTLKREASLRQTTLLHAHQMETARKAYEAEKAKIEDEARQARKLVREKLTSAVEERRRKLKEEKESGENAIGEWQRIIRALAASFADRPLPVCLA